MAELLITPPQFGIMTGSELTDLSVAANLTYEYHGGNPEITIVNPEIGPINIIATYNAFYFSGNVDANAEAYAQVMVSTNGGSSYSSGPEMFVQLAGGSHDRCGIRAEKILVNATPSGNILIRVQVKGSKSSGTPGFAKAGLGVWVFPYQNI